MVFRPGHLGDFRGMTPRRRNISLGSHNSRVTLGNFGKGAFIPPPAAPPGGAPPGATALAHAVDKRTGKSYMQDPGCPEGEKKETKGVPCVGNDCCDAPGDCDPPGTVYQETDCFDDLNYQELPEEPAGGWKDCISRNRAGYPEPCNDRTCPTCFTPKQQAAPAAPSGAPGDDAETAAMAAELEMLEAEHGEVQQMVTQSAAMPPPSAYTGSPMPVMTNRARRSAPTGEDRIAAMVSAHETRKAVQRSTSPQRMVVSAPAPVAPVSAPAPVAAPRKDIGGLFSWLRSTLFGAPRTYDFDGLGQMSKQTNILIPLIVGLGILIVLRSKSGS